MASNKILVIDDSRVIRVRVKEMLPPGNFEVLEAKDGLEGINLILQEKPNLIMLDFLLPKLSGWEVNLHFVESADIFARLANTKIHFILVSMYFKALVHNSS